MCGGRTRRWSPPFHTTNTVDTNRVAAVVVTSKKVRPLWHGTAKWWSFKLNYTETLISRVGSLKQTEILSLSFFFFFLFACVSACNYIKPLNIRCTWRKLQHLGHYPLPTHREMYYFFLPSRPLRLPSLQLQQLTFIWFMIMYTKNVKSKWREWAILPWGLGWYISRHYISAKMLAWWRHVTLSFTM